MKNQYLYFLGIILVFIASGFTSLGINIAAISDDCFSMIFNDRVTKKSWIYLNQDESKVYKVNSDLSEGDVLKMKKNSWDAIYTDNLTNKTFSTPDKTNTSFKFVTLGYAPQDQNKEVGFGFTVLNNIKKDSDPYIFRIVNNSQKENRNTLGILREVGFVFDNWPQYWPQTKEWTGADYSFKDHFIVNDLEKIKVKFKYRLLDYKGSLYKDKIKEKWLGSYVTCDFRFNEYDENGKIIYRYLIGVVFSNPLRVDFNNNPNDEILFGSGVVVPDEQGILLLHGNSVGVKEVNKISYNNKFETVEIDFKPLIDKYLSVRKNKRNIVTGVDIYSATRAANISYEIQDIQVIGCKK